MKSQIYDATMNTSNTIVESESYIGTNALIALKEYAPQLVDVLRYPEKSFSDAAIELAVPSMFYGTQFSLSKSFTFFDDGTHEKPVDCVTDGEAVFNERYFWVATEILGAEIFPGQRKKADRHKSPWALVKDGKVIGSIMPMKRTVVDKAE